MSPRIIRSARFIHSCLPLPTLATFTTAFLPIQIGDLFLSLTGWRWRNIKSFIGHNFALGSQQTRHSMKCPVGGKKASSARAPKVSINNPTAAAFDKILRRGGAIRSDQKRPFQPRDNRRAGGRTDVIICSLLRLPSAVREDRNRAGEAGREGGRRRETLL